VSWGATTTVRKRMRKKDTGAKDTVYLVRRGATTGEFIKTYGLKREVIEKGKRRARKELCLEGQEP
jgi:hypothetical protein